MSIYQLAGLSPNEAKCYEALLKLGNSSANEISRASGTHRVAVYDALRGLREKGLVSQITAAGRMEFSPASPEILQESLERKEEEIAKAKDELPALHSLFENNAGKTEIEMYKGKSGVKQVFSQMLFAKEIMDFGAEFHIKEFLEGFYSSWDRKRVQKKIPMRIVANKRISPVKLPLTKIRFVPEEFASNVSTYIYDGKVTLVLWVEPMLACTFIHRTVHDSYRSHFEYLWKTAQEE